MGFPNQKELERVRKKLKVTDAARILPADASKADKLKFELCKKIIRVIRDSGETQAQFAKRLEIDPARLSEIVKYKIELFTLDRLMDYVERVDPKFTVSVA